ncbi:MAG: SURF1 family protein [Rickettsiales bacterium]
MKFRKPELIPLIFIVLATGLLCTLGMWQIERLAWKNDLIADIKAGQHAPTLNVWKDDAYYRNIEIEGTFIHDKTLKKVGRVQGKTMVYLQLTPFQLETGEIVLVNRGYVPEDAQASMPGAASITGIIRPLRGKRLFTPDNHPEKNLWLYEDIDAMSRFTGLPLENAIIETTGDSRISDDQPEFKLRNDHLGYAITWFLLAVIGLIMFAIYHRIPEEKS